MKRNYYILKSGRLRRKQNTLYLEKENEKIPIPINNVNAISIFGEIDLNTKLLVFLAQNKIPVHFFNYYGFYSGTYYPREYLNSGFLIVKQVEHYLDSEKRVKIAKKFVEATGHNILKNLTHYKKHGKDVKGTIEIINTELKKIKVAEKIPEIMGIEGNIRNAYYKCFNEILRPGFGLEKRVKRPPNNMTNTLISFGNSVLYTTVLSEIYRTQLNPTISYLHEPHERRFSLALDISEAFKPILVDRVIFKLINNRIIKEKDFLKELNFCYLNKSGRRTFLSEYEQKLQSTLRHKTLKRNVTYQRLIRLDCYKLIKHLIGEKDFEAFKVWW